MKEDINVFPMCEPSGKKEEIENNENQRFRDVIENEAQEIAHEIIQHLENGERLTDEGTFIKIQ